VIRTVEHAAAAWVAASSLFDVSDAWRLPLEVLEQLLAGADPPSAGAVPAASAWEPFLREAILANGVLVHGEPASEGVGAGRLLGLSAPRRLAGARERWVLAVAQPVPGYAPLLWGAAGLVSASGSSSAHLFDVARSLGVPAVAGLGAEALRPGAVVAVDGSSGEVVAI